MRKQMRTLLYKTEKSAYKRKRGSQSDAYAPDSLKSRIAYRFVPYSKERKCSIMKKTILSLILCLALLLCAACAAPAAGTAEAAQPQAQSAAPEAEATEAPQGGMPPYSCAISFESLNEEFEAEDGTIIMLLTGQAPHVEVDSNEKATAAFESYFKEKVDEVINDEAAETLEMAKADFAERGEGFMPYSLGLNYATQRADKDCVSFSVDEYSYTGGAHPNSRREGVSFDTETGRELEFKDIVTDEAAAREFLAESIKAYLDANKEYYGLFDDYTEHINEIIDEDEWYFTNTEFVMICNEYIIGPHAMGIIEIPIAYSDFVLLNSDYAIAK